MTSSLVFAAVGAKALWLLYIWLASCIAASALSRSKGYGEKAGLGTGLLLSALAPIIWLFIPPKDETAEWHHLKPWQRRPKAADMLGLTEEVKAGETAMEPAHDDAPAAPSAPEAPASDAPADAGDEPDAGPRTDA